MPISAMNNMVHVAMTMLKYLLAKYLNLSIGVVKISGSILYWLSRKTVAEANMQVTKIIFGAINNNVWLMACAEFANTKAEPRCVVISTAIQIMAIEAAQKPPCLICCFSSKGNNLSNILVSLISRTNSSSFI